MPRVAFGNVDDFFRRPFRHNFSTARTAFRAEVNDPVRCFDYVEIVFNDDERVAGVAQFEQHFQQHARHH